MSTGYCEKCGGMVFLPTHIHDEDTKMTTQKTELPYEECFISTDHDGHRYVSMFPEDDTYATQAFAIPKDTAIALFTGRTMSCEACNQNADILQGQIYQNQHLKDAVMAQMEEFSGALNRMKIAEEAAEKILYWHEIDDDNWETAKEGLKLLKKFMEKK